jgi:nucleoside-diphosphate-sugar epimerase
VIRYLDKTVKRIAGEHMVHAYAKLYGFRAVALRYANVVGPKPQTWGGVGLHEQAA